MKERIKFEKFFFFLDTCEIVIFGLDIDKRLLLCRVERNFIV